VEVEGGHLATACVAQAENGCLRGWNAVGVLIDQELVVGAVIELYSTVRWSRISMFLTAARGLEQRERVYES
jgi:hypothetical protein